jgi:hypothetical protein
MALKTVTAMFDRYEDAARAVSRLEQAGIPHSEISLVSNDPSHRGPNAATDAPTKHDDAGPATGTGASLGTVLGGGAGLLAGLGMLAIPGLGPVVAAGWLASTLVGAGAGAAAGGVLGALTGAGIDEAHAHTYAEGIKRGGTLVTVRADETRLATVTGILDDDGTVDVVGREEAWRQEGWNGRYDPDYAPGTTGALSGGPIGAAASTTTGLGTSGTGLGTGGTAGTGLGTTGTPTGTGVGSDLPGTRVRTYPI